MLLGMKQPIFVGSLTDEERRRLEAGLRSSDAQSKLISLSPKKVA